MSEDDEVRFFSGLLASLCLLAAVLLVIWSVAVWLGGNGR